MGRCPRWRRQIRASESRARDETQKQGDKRGKARGIMEVFLFMRGTNIWNTGRDCHYSIRLSSHFHNRHLTYGSRICTQDMYFIIKPPLNLSVSNTITPLLLSNSAVQTPSAIIFPTITSAARSHLSLLRPISLDSSKPFRHLQYLGSLNIRFSSQWGPYILILSCTPNTPLNLQAAYLYKRHIKFHSDVQSTISMGANPPLSHYEAREMNLAISSRAMISGV